MRIEFGSEVTDRNGSPLGTVDYVIRDVWSGEVRKFVVFRKAPRKDLFFTPGDVVEASDTQVRVKAETSE